MGLLLPTWFSVAGELCTPPVKEAVRSAWGIEASEFRGHSEGTYAFPCPGVVNFFIGKTHSGVDVSVVTDGSSDLQRLRMELIDVLRRHGGPDSDVDVHEVGSIERLSRGKSKQFDTDVI